MTKSRFRVLSHPVHPMLVVFPTALFPLALLFDAAYWYTGDAMYWNATLWIVALGALSTIGAAIPGIVDFAGIPDASKAHRTGLLHFATGTAILIAYLAATWVRWPPGSPVGGSFSVAVGLSLVGTLLVTVQGWLGGDLVYKHHIGVPSVEEGAEPTPLEPGGFAVGDHEESPGPDRV